MTTYYVNGPILEPFLKIISSKNIFMLFSKISGGPEGSGPECSEIVVGAVYGSRGYLTAT